MDWVAYFVRMLNRMTTKQNHVFNPTQYEKKNCSKNTCNFSFDELNIFLETKTKSTKKKNNNKGKDFFLSDVEFLCEK